MSAFSKRFIVVTGLLVILVSAPWSVTAQKADRFRPELRASKSSRQMAGPRIDFGKYTSHPSLAPMPRLSEIRAAVLNPLTAVLTPAPANNDFSNAQIISGTFNSVTGTNVTATKQPGEPNHAGDAGGASVWYLWQAPSNGPVGFVTTGSDFDTLLAVYTGSSVSSLSLIDSNDDANNTRQSEVFFDAQLGTVYYIAVDGFNAATGSIVLSWAMTGPFFNSRLAVQVRDDGRFNMGAFPNLSGNGTTGSWDLMYRWPNDPGTSFSTLRIDGIDNVYGSSGIQLQAPANIDVTTNRSKWRIGDIEITQTLEIVFNPQTNQNDVAKISYVARNTGSVSHQAGLRVMIDSEVNYNDGVPFRVPGVGIVATEREFTGASVPDTFQGFFDVTDSSHVAVSTLKSGGATAPDRLVLASWPRIVATDYNYVIAPSIDFTADSAYALYWNPTSLAPGASRTYVTFYGLSQLDVNLQPPLALGVTAPATLSIVNGQYSPNPFDVVATVFNNGNASATNVRLSLNLPAGLSLAAGTAIQDMGNLAVGQEKQASWRVTAASQAVQTTLGYSVDATASNAQTKTVSRQITLGALCTGPPLVSDQPVSKTFLTGSSIAIPTLTIGAASFQWYRGIKGDTSSPVSGATSNSLVFPASSIVSRTDYWLRATNACGSVNSDTATVVITDRRPLIFVPGIAGSRLDRFVLGVRFQNLWLGGVSTDHSLLAKPESSSRDIRADDVLRHESIALGLANEDIYGTLLTTLTNSSKGGYREYSLDYDTRRLTFAGCNFASQVSNNPTLFAFPYDWRGKNEGNAALLKDYVTCVQTFYPGMKIDILAHSMGGLLSRRFILDNPNVVNKLVTVGAPWLGAPKAIYTMKTGFFLDKGLKGRLLVTDGTIKALAEYFPGVHQLLPSESYFSFGSLPYAFNGNFLSYSDFTNRFDKVDFSRSTPVSVGKTFHGFPGQDNWNPAGQGGLVGDTSVDYYHFYGIQKGSRTIEGVIEQQVKVLGVPLWSEFLPWFNQGDGTVPRISATREGMTRNLNAPSVISNPGRLKKYEAQVDSDSENEKVSHSGLVRNTQVICDAMSIFSIVNPQGCPVPPAGITSQISESAIQAESAPLYHVRIAGATSVVVSDSNNNSTEPLKSPPDSLVPGVDTYALAERSALIVLPTNQTFSIKYKTPSNAISIEVTKKTDITTSEATRYQDVILPPNVFSLLTFTPQGFQNLSYDANGDGVFETVVTPTVSLVGTAASDSTQPVVSVSGVAQQGLVNVTISATDTGSGIKSIRYSLDDINYVNYSGVFSLDPFSRPVVYAFADDNVANRSSLITFYPTLSGNTIDNAQFFARQHYIDFLNREPDAPGLAHWTAEMTDCSTAAKRQPGESLAQCVERKRANTSAAFFFSPEFQNTGSFVLRVYWGTLGKLPSAQCPGVPLGLAGNCRPQYSQYVSDAAQLSQGIVINDKLAPDVINANKHAFVDQFVSRAEFKARYDGLTSAQFVDRLVQTTGVTLTSPERDALVAELTNGGGTDAAKANVVFKVVDGTQTITDGALVFQTRYGQSFYNQEFDAAFVFMEYLGYLHRNPDQAGYDFWLTKLKQYGNFVDAQMVLAFIVSPEYRSRFGQP